MSIGHLLRDVGCKLVSQEICNDTIVASTSLHMFVHTYVHILRRQSVLCLPARSQILVCAGDRLSAGILVHRDTRVFKVIRTILHDLFYPLTGTACC